MSMYVVKELLKVAVCEIDSYYAIVLVHWLFFSEDQIVIKYEIWSQQCQFFWNFNHHILSFSKYEMHLILILPGWNVSNWSYFNLIVSRTQGSNHILLIIDIIWHASALWNLSCCYHYFFSGFVCLAFDGVFLILFHYCLLCIYIWIVSFCLLCIR